MTQHTIIILLIFALGILTIITAARVLQGLFRIVMIMAIIAVTVGVGLWATLL